MKTVCLDFDGVIHSYTSPWTTAEEIRDPPMPGAFEFIRQLLNSGFRVCVLSSRFKDDDDFNARHAVRCWFLEYGFGSAEATCRIDLVSEKPAAVLYIDDRGFRFEGEWPSVEFIENFKPWKLNTEGK